MPKCPDNFGTHHSKLKIINLKDENEKGTEIILRKSRGVRLAQSEECVSWGCEFKPHSGCRAYLKNFLKKKERKKGKAPTYSHMTLSLLPDKCECLDQVHNSCSIKL